MEIINFQQQIYFYCVYRVLSMELLSLHCLDITNKLFLHKLNVVEFDITSKHKLLIFLRFSLP